MIESTISLPTAGGAMPTFVVRPEPPGPFPLVVMLMDGGGVREGLRANARSLAAQGYYVMLPNLFHRSAGTGPIEDLFDMARITELNTGLKLDEVAGDVRACAAHAAADPQARGADRMGLIGYCMGGRLSVSLAQVLGERVAAVASLHPGYMATRAPTSPHLFLDNIKARIYLGVAEHDPHLSPGAVERLRAALDANGVDYRLEVIAGTEHGFAVPGRESYNPDGAAHAERCALELFRARLQAGTPA